MTLPTGPTAERLELAATVVELHDGGVSHSEIARRLGISRSYASELYHDPDGSRARRRKDGYAGTCIRCGAATSGSNGRERASDTCGDCAHVLAHEGRFWTRELIVDAIREFERIVGRPPLATEWNIIESRTVTDTYAPAPERFGRWPYVAEVLREFESTKGWGDAIVAAGFDRPKVGNKPRGVLPHGQRRPGVPARPVTYVVLETTTSGKLKEIGRVDARDPSTAIRKVLDNPADSLDGEYFAVSTNLLGSPFVFTSRPVLARRGS